MFVAFSIRNFFHLLWCLAITIFYWLHRIYHYQTFHRTYTQYFKANYNRNIVKYIELLSNRVFAVNSAFASYCYSSRTSFEIIRWHYSYSSLVIACQGPQKKSSCFDLGIPACWWLLGTFTFHWSLLACLVS